MVAGMDDPSSIALLEEGTSKTIMKNPQMRTEVKKEWVEYMLSEFENRNNPGSKVTVADSSWSIEDATKKGDGYSGVLVKLEAKGSVECTGNGQHEKEYHHILKFQSCDPWSQEFLKRLNIKRNETMIYSSVIEELNRFQESYSDNQFPINIPPHIYSTDYLLVMENMKVLDYDNNSKKNGLGLEEAKLALEQLARLHGISYAYHKKHDFLKKYPSYNSELFKQMLNVEYDGVIDMAIDFLKTQNEHQDLLKKVQTGKKHVVKRMHEAFKERTTQIYCLNHSDPWNNNILVKKSGDAKEDKIVFVDWEGAHWNISSYDIGYFIAGALIPEMRKHHIDDLLKHYHSHFTSVTTTLGSPIPEWGFEQLKSEYDAVLGFTFGRTLIFTMVLSEASKDWKMNNNDVTHPVKRSIKKGFAKVLTPLMLKPCAIKAMMKGMMKQLCNPVLKELKSRSNYDLNERFLACILEADQNGLFDIPLE